MCSYIDLLNDINTYANKCIEFNNNFIIKLYYLNDVKRILFCKKDYIR